MPILPLALLTAVTAQAAIPEGEPLSIPSYSPNICATQQGRNQVQDTSPIAQGNFEAMLRDHYQSKSKEMEARLSALPVAFATKRAIIDSATQAPEVRAETETLRAQLAELEPEIEALGNDISTQPRCQKAVELTDRVVAALDLIDRQWHRIAQAIRAKAAEIDTHAASRSAQTKTAP